MVNRIQEILQKYNLTAARFADQLDVPRSTISHIMSERNKPSLEFIQKVLDGYPDIDINWLLKGEGSIFGAQKDLFSELEDRPISNQETISKVSQVNPRQDNVIPAVDTAEKKYAIPEGESVSAKSAEIPVIPDIFKDEGAKKNGRKLRKIIMIYDDSTFEEFSPAE